MHCAFKIKYQKTLLISLSILSFIRINSLLPGAGGFDFGFDAVQL
jgi:hypothetical protein